MQGFEIVINKLKLMYYKRKANRSMKAKDREAYFKLKGLL